MYVVGNDYLQTPSLEPLPFQEGEYETDHLGNITVRMRSSGVAYTHPSLQVDGANICIDFLSIKVWGWGGHPGTLQVSKAPATGFQCRRSLVMNYIRDAIGSEPRYKSLDVSHRELPEPWTERDAESFVRYVEKERLTLTFPEVA